MFSGIMLQGNGTAVQKMNYINWCTYRHLVCFMVKETWLIVYFS
jgi:hypothetical protein